jgi:amino acid transporter
VSAEPEKSRIDRELIELLNELRVALPGVQVLFAFLLILPFSNGFPKVSEAERDVYFAAVACTTIATVLFIAPTTYHRIRFRAGDKERLVRTGNRLVLAGSVFLGTAMCCTVFLISEFVFSVPFAIVATALAAVNFTWFWYGLPLWHASDAEDA